MENLPCAIIRMDTILRYVSDMRRPCLRFSSAVRFAAESMLDVAVRLCHSRRRMRFKLYPSITPDGFRDYIVANQVYRTPRAHTAAAPWLRSLRYHLIIMRCVWRGARLARRGEYDGDAWALSSATILLAVEALGGRLVIKGLETPAKLNGPFVIAANHMSALETYALACMLLPFTKLTFVIKSSLLSYPLFGDILRNLHPIALTRSDPRADLKTLLKEGLRCLADGVSLIVFPQARRRKVFVPDDFNTIGCKLAGRAGVPLVPLALKTDFLRHGFPMFELGRVDPGKVVRFEFGEPIMARGREKQAHAETIEFIGKRLRNWRVPVVDGYE